MFVSASRWSVGKNRRRPAVLEIAYGSGKHFPQYAALHTRSSYLRLTGGPGMTWGTSVVLLPVVWQAKKAGPTQGALIVVTGMQEDNGALVLDFTGRIAGLHAAGRLRFLPPAADQFQVNVEMSVCGTTPLNAAHAPEAFKTIMLSSMHFAPNVWDTNLAFAGADTYPLPHPPHWIIAPSLSCHTFGLRGGRSQWQKYAPAPTLTITSSEFMPVAGWISSPEQGRAGGPNSDNVALWTAQDHVRPNWQYTISAQAVPSPKQNLP